MGILKSWCLSRKISKEPSKEGLGGHIRGAGRRHLAGGEEGREKGENKEEGLQGGEWRVKEEKTEERGRKEEEREEEWGIRIGRQAACLRTSP